MKRLLRAALLPALFASLLGARAVRIEVLERSPVLNRRAFAAGPYERVLARVHFALDPKHPANRALADLSLAPRSSSGMVEFSADLYLLQPSDPRRSNGTLLVEIPNRGGKALLNRFCYARGSPDPQTPEEFGDSWLLDSGFTLAWIGWQWDVPAGNPRLLRLHTPLIAGIEGVVRHLGKLLDLGQEAEQEQPGIGFDGGHGEFGHPRCSKQTLSWSTAVPAGRAF
jgi:hypothetical protein